MAVGLCTGCVGRRGAGRGRGCARAPRFCFFFLVFFSWFSRLPRRLPRSRAGLAPQNTVTCTPHDHAGVVLARPCQRVHPAHRAASAHNGAPPAASSLVQTRPVPDTVSARGARGCRDGGMRLWPWARRLAVAVAAVAGVAAPAAGYEVVLDSRQQRCVTEELEPGTHVRLRAICVVFLFVCVGGWRRAVAGLPGVHPRASRADWRWCHHRHAMAATLSSATNSACVLLGLFSLLSRPAWRWWTDARGGHGGGCCAWG